MPSLVNSSLRVSNKFKKDQHSNMLSNIKFSNKYYFYSKSKYFDLEFDFKTLNMKFK